MPNPVFVTLVADQWTLVANNVTAGTIRVTKRGVGPVLQTYVLTGGAAPVARTLGAALDSDNFEVASTAAIDVYMWIDRKAGEVRRDVS